MVTREAALGEPALRPRPSPCARGRPRRSGRGRGRRARRPDSPASSFGSSLSISPSARTATPKLRPIARRLMIAPSTMSQMCGERHGLVGELLGDDASAWRRPPCRCRARGGRPCGPSPRRRTSAASSRASSIRLRTSSTPTWRAVWKPKVGTCGGSGRSLSIVFGTWTLRIAPCDRSRDRARRERRVVAADGDEVRDAGLLQRLDDRLQRLGRLGRVLARRAEHRAARQVDARHVVDGRAAAASTTSRRTRFLKPSRMPTTSKPSLMASMVADEMTVLMPGAGPPPTRMPSRLPCAHGCPDSFRPVTALSTCQPAGAAGAGRMTMARPLEGAPHAIPHAVAPPLAAAIAAAGARPRPAHVRSRRRRRDGRCRWPTSTASATCATSTIAPDGAWVAYTVGFADIAARQGRRRHLDVELGRHRARPPDDEPRRANRSRASAPTASGSRSSPAATSGDDDKTTGGQIWLLSRQGGEARRLTTRKGGAGDFQWSPDSTRLVLRRRRPRSRGGQGRRRQDAEEADRHRPLRLQARRRRLPVHRRSHLYLLTVATGAIETLTTRRLRRLAAGVVARRHADRLHQRPRQRRRPHQRHQRLRRGRQGRRRAAGADDLERARRPGAAGLEPRRRLDRLPPGQRAEAVRLQPQHAGGGAGRGRPRRSSSPTPRPIDVDVAGLDAGRQGALRHRRRRPRPRAGAGRRRPAGRWCR